jgi:hypothetical protein
MDSQETKHEGLQYAVGSRSKSRRTTGPTRPCSIKVVPAGKQLIVEFVSTSSEMPPGQKPHPVIVILESSGSAVVQHYPVTQFQLNYRGADIYNSADSVRMHLPRNLTLRVLLLRDGTAGTARCFFGISGHFEAA